MVRSWLYLLVMAAVVAALSAWVYYRPEVGKTESYALSQLKAANVKRIRLERFEPETTVELERRGDVWRVTAPFSARADGFQVERLLAIVDTRSVGRFASKDLDRYGLAQPSSRVTLDGQTFAFGAVNTATREQYVLTDGAVYAIALTQRTAIPRDPDALISRALFAPHEAPVRIEAPVFAAALEDGAWKFTPALDDVTPDERNEWADRWRQALAVRAARHDGKSAESAIKVEFKHGGTLELGILQREPELVLLRADEGIQYYFFAEAAKRLLSPPAPVKGDAVTK